MVMLQFLLLSFCRTKYQLAQQKYEPYSAVVAVVLPDVWLQRERLQKAVAFESRGREK